METLLLPFSPRFIVLTICAVVTALLLGIGIFDHNPKAFDVVLDPDAHLRRRSRCSASAISCRRATRCCATIRSRRICASCSRKSARRCGSISSRARRTACRSPATSARWSISAPRCSSTSGRSARRRTSIARAMSGCIIRWRRSRMPSEKFRIDHRRARLHKALFGLGLQHLRDELWRALAERRAGAECRRQEGRLCARHRRGRRQPLSPRDGRRHHLGDRLGLFRLPHTATASSTRTNSRGSRPTTRSRWSSSRSARAPSPAMAACCRPPRSPRRFPGSAACRWARTASRRQPTARSRRRSR